MRKNTIAWFLGVFFLIAGVLLILARTYYYYSFPNYILYGVIGFGIFLIIIEVVTYNSAF